MGSPVFGSWLTRFSKSSPATTSDGESLTSTGFIVLMSEDEPSMTRPPATGFSPGEAEACSPPVGVGVHAVATNREAANIEITTRPVCLCAAMCPPLVPFAYRSLVPEFIRAASRAAHPVLYGRAPPAVHFWSRPPCTWAYGEKLPG